MQQWPLNDQRAMALLGYRQEQRECEPHRRLSLSWVN